jgi:eukaryotic-like serine/threonine-protein kinase
VATPRAVLHTRGPVDRAPSDRSSSNELARVFTDEDDHSLVQNRLGMLYGVLGTISLTFYVIGIITMAIGLPKQFWTIHLSPAKVAHAVTGPTLLAVWLFCRRARLLPRWLLSSFDLVGLLMLLATVSTMIAFTPWTGLHAEFMVLPAVMLAASLRAALVPSPPRWTALVVAIAVTPAPFAAYEATLRDPTWSVELAPRIVIVMMATGWCIVAVGGAIAISKVVYGLRSEVKNATRLGQYTLEDKIGEGGMGVVYRARHALLRRPTAIKLLSPDRAGPHEIRRFEREVQLTSMLTHPNTVAIYDFGHTRDGVFYYAMEHLEGVSLHDLVERDGAQPSGRVVFILAQIASALAEAHAVGLVHRDVKPANVFLCERGGLPDFVKVLDFGLVKQTGQTDPALSRVDAIAGTPHYMAPESITDPSSVDGRVDLYALGAVGYFLLTASTPFDGNNLVEICSHHLHTKPQPPSTRVSHAVSSKLEHIILACLEKSRDARPPSASRLVELLDACQEECAWDVALARDWWTREKAAKSAASAPRTPSSKEKRSANTPAQPAD